MTVTDKGLLQTMVFSYNQGCGKKSTGIRISTPRTSLRFTHRFAGRSRYPGIFRYWFNAEGRHK